MKYDFGSYYVEPIKQFRYFHAIIDPKGLDTVSKNLLKGVNSKIYGLDYLKVYVIYDVIIGFGSGTFLSLVYPLVHWSSTFVHGCTRWRCGYRKEPNDSAD